MVKNTNFSALNKPENKEKIAILCVGYNRLNSMKRLLGSLLNAKYPSFDIPLLISIDASGNEELYQFVKDVEWPFGEKYVNIEIKRLGLKKHIFQCCDLTRYFKAVIILEDDLFVSPCFYNFVCNSIDFYRDEPKIVGIALYSPEVNGYVGLPFVPLNNGSDAYLMQDVCTWGEAFTYTMWKRFCNWKERDDCEKIIQDSEIPKQIKQWSNAWSKYYYGFMYSNGYFFVYPYQSLTTNFSDAGTHGVGTNNVQVSIKWQQLREYKFQNFDKCIKYDVFSNNMLLYNYLGFNEEQLCLDVYGNNKNIKKKKYLLSSKELPYKIIKSYGLHFRPQELNILYKIPGDEIRLYDTSVSASTIKIGVYQQTDYYLRGFNISMLRLFVFHNLLNILKRKLHL